MTIPNFSPTDHYEYKKWSQDLIKRLKAASQNLYYCLKKEDEINIGALHKALDEAEVCYAIVKAAREELPKNLAVAFEKLLAPVFDRLNLHIASAKHNLEKNHA